MAAAQSYVDRVVQRRHNAARHGCWLRTAAALAAWLTYNAYARQRWYELATCPGGLRLSARAGRCKHGTLQVVQGQRSVSHCPVVSLALEYGPGASGSSDADFRAGGADLFLSLAAGLGRPGEVPEDGPAGDHRL